MEQGQGLMLSNAEKHWFWEVLDVVSAHPPTDCVLFHAHTPHLATEALLLSGHVFGTVSQHSCTMKTLPITILGMN